MKNSLKRNIIASVVIILLAVTFKLSMDYNVRDREVLVFQFGKLINVYTDEGIYFKIPYIQTTKSIFVGERIYDIPRTNVTTSDKKSMICDAYATWKITDIKKYYSKLSSVEAAQDRLNATVRTIKSNAEAEAADVIADGETQYYQILADVYSKSEDKNEFYKYWSGLEALKTTLQNGGTYVIDQNSPLYDVLIDK